MAVPTTVETAGDQDGEAVRPPRRRRRLIVTVALAATTVLGGTGTWLLYGSAWLRATQVRVTGTEVLYPEEVRDAAEVPLDGPLVSVDTAVIARRLKERLPRISAVEVERSWPHTITLKVTERTPAALVKGDGNFIEVDADGVRFDERDTPLKGVPIIELRPDRSSASYRHFGTKRLLAGAVQVAADLPKVAYRDARLIEVRSYDDITVQLTRGRAVVWGSVEQGAEKSVALAALMKVERDAEFYDVSAPTSPAASDG
ncbi:FtsQ-type POTRA domain-containing protein [Streptomyces sp. NPDC026673]|uniref:cell division protein FtsQ/DivIB n=1 Tax=Streptomyces sp. NPDC026673 TaxID=3155724 RepID=UPI0033FF046C